MIALSDGNKLITNNIYDDLHYKDVTTEKKSHYTLKKIPNNNTILFYSSTIPTILST